MINFDELYRNKYSIQVALINRYVKNVIVAEDIVQETYSRALKYQSSYNPNKASVETWINKILFNTLRSYKAGDINKQNLEVDDKGELVEKQPEDLSYEIVQENYEVVAEEIEKVKSNKSKDILRLFYLVGYRSNEISEALGVSQTSITSCCSRFKHKMTERFKLEI